jgi:phosphoglycolate phosphatase-like HAD superfamily hydrolase
VSSDRPTIAVFDIDGVLADVRHRLHHVERSPKNWDAFFAGMADDGPLEDGINAARELAADGHRIVYLTGRNESYRRLTTSWLTSHGLPEGRLIMRADSDRRPARQFKPAALRRVARDGLIVTVIDDDIAVVTALRRDGWPVFQATWMGSAPEQQKTLFDAQETEGRS